MCPTDDHLRQGQSGRRTPLYKVYIPKYKFSEMPQMEQIQKQSGPLVEMCFKTLLKFDRWQPIQDYIKVEAIKPGRPDTSKF